MGSVFSNTVLLAIPLIFPALGEGAGRRLMLIITFHSVIIFPVVTVLIELGLGAGRGWRTLAGSTVRSLALTPIVLALLAGLAYAQSGVALPVAAGRSLALHGHAPPPCAPFALHRTRLA